MDRINSEREYVMEKLFNLLDEYVYNMLDIWNWEMSNQYYDSPLLTSYYLSFPFVCSDAVPYCLSTPRGYLDKLKYRTDFQKAIELQITQFYSHITELKSNFFIIPELHLFEDLTVIFFIILCKNWIGHKRETKEYCVHILKAPFIRFYTELVTSYHTMYINLNSIDDWVDFIVDCITDFIERE
jgi:hypothetical protein